LKIISEILWEDILKIAHPKPTQELTGNKAEYVKNSMEKIKTETKKQLLQLKNRSRMN